MTENDLQEAKDAYEAAAAQLAILGYVFIGLAVRKSGEPVVSVNVMFGAGSLLDRAMQVWDLTGIDPDGQYNGSLYAISIFLFCEKTYLGEGRRDGGVYEVYARLDYRHDLKAVRDLKAIRRVPG